jgi:SnoaL-like protein
MTQSAPTATTATRDSTASTAIERIYHAWDEALGARDLDAALALYHPEATLESPLVCHLLGRPDGVVQGREALRDFIRLVFANQSPKRKRHRTTYLTDGTLLTWEYPGTTPDGEQLDIVEVMEIRGSLIAHHRVYWGWRSVATLSEGQPAR